MIRFILFIEYSVKYLYAVQKKWSVLKNSQ